MPVHILKKTQKKKTATARPRRASPSDTPVIPLPSEVLTIVEAVFRCKWSLHILALIGRGIHRPGQIQRALPGLTTKVENECFRRLIQFHIVTRVAYPEIPPRVEYDVTTRGKKILSIVKSIHALEAEWAGDNTPRTPSTAATKMGAGT